MSRQRRRTQLVDQPAELVDLGLELLYGLRRGRLDLLDTVGALALQRRRQRDANRGQALEGVVVQLLRPVLALALADLDALLQPVGLDALGGGDGRGRAGGECLK